MIVILVAIYWYAPTPGWRDPEIIYKNHYESKSYITRMVYDMSMSKQAAVRGRGRPVGRGGPRV